MEIKLQIQLSSRPRPQFLRPTLKCKRTRPVGPGVASEVHSCFTNFKWSQLLRDVHMTLKGKENTMLSQQQCDLAQMFKSGTRSIGTHKCEVLHITHVFMTKSMFISPPPPPTPAFQYPPFHTSSYAHPPMHSPIHPSLAQPP